MQPAVASQRTHQEQTAEGPSLRSHYPGGHAFCYDVIIIILGIFTYTLVASFCGSYFSLCLLCVRPVRSVKRVRSADGSNSKTCWCRRCRDSPSTHCCWTASSNTLRVRRRLVRNLAELETFMWNKRNESFCFFTLQPLSHSPCLRSLPLCTPFLISPYLITFVLLIAIAPILFSLLPLYFLPFHLFSLSPHLSPYLYHPPIPTSSFCCSFYCSFTFVILFLTSFPHRHPLPPSAGSPDLSSLHRAQACCRAIVQAVDDRVGQMEHQQRLNQYLRRLDASPQFKVAIQLKLLLLPRL